MKTCSCSDSCCICKVSRCASYCFYIASIISGQCGQTVGLVHHTVYQNVSFGSKQQQVT